MINFVLLISVLVFYAILLCLFLPKQTWPCKVVCKISRNAKITKCLSIAGIVLLIPFFGLIFTILCLVGWLIMLSGTQTIWDAFSNSHELSEVKPFQSK